MSSVLATFKSTVGEYRIEDHGAGVHAVMFKPKRARNFRVISMPRSMDGALRAISEHEGDLLEPAAPRETGRNGPVSIYAVGRRLSAKTPTALDRELERYRGK